MRLLCMLIFFICVENTLEDARKVSYGPYKSTTLRVQQCKATTYPMDPDSPIKMIIELYNSSKKNFLLRGNISVVRDNKRIKMTIKHYKWQNGQFKMQTMGDHLGCHGIAYNTMIMALGIKYDRETCGFLKGQYYFENVDMDTLMHFWKKETEYGRYLRVSETGRGNTTYACWEFEILVSPL